MLTLPALEFEVLPEIDSSNSELLRRVRSGLRTPLLLHAQQQIAGRGRLGRRWHGDAATALTFSLGLPLVPKDWSGLSLAVGLAIAQSLHPRLQLKWPNDIYLDGRKLAGILIETASMGAERYAIMGVGINIDLPPDQGALTVPPAALTQVLPGITAAQTLERVVPALLAAITRFEAEGFAAVRPAFAARDALYGRDVVCSDGLAGVARGVDDSGALLLESAQGWHRLTSTEVSVRAQDSLV